MAEDNTRSPQWAAPGLRAPRTFASDVSPKSPKRPGPPSSARPKSAAARDDPFRTRDGADPLFLRRHDDEKFDHEGVPRLGEHLGLADAVIKGVDFPPPCARGRVSLGGRIPEERPVSLGALVTTHKIDLYHACLDQFDAIDRHARLHGRDELPVEARRPARLPRQGPDLFGPGARRLPARSPFRADRRRGVLDGRRWVDDRAHLASHATGPRRDRPTRIVVSNRSPARLEEIRRIHAELGSGVPTEYVLAAPTPRDNDAVLASFEPGSLVINATGLGKDAPGSPADRRRRGFPNTRIAWDLNYRGELVFLDQARAQQPAAWPRDRGRLDILPARLDAGDRRSVPHRTFPCAARRIRMLSEIAAHAAKV